MEQDIALALLIRQRDFLGAAKYVAENTKDQAIRARRIREVIGAAKELALVEPYDRMDELLDTYGPLAGIEPPPVEVHDPGVAKTSDVEELWRPGDFDGEVTVAERDIIARESVLFEEDDEVTREWEDVPTVPMKPVSEDAS